MPAWTFADAWFFEAIALGPPTGVSLREAMWVGDAINRSVFTRIEIEQAVNRLHGAGLLDVEHERFYLTPAGLALHGRSPETYPFERVKWVQSELSRTAAPTGSMWSLRDEDWQRAYDEYSNWFRVQLAKAGELGFASPEDAALADCPASARARVTSIVNDGDRAVVTYDTTPSWPVASTCERLSDGTWAEISVDLNGLAQRDPPDV